MNKTAWKRFVITAALLLSSLALAKETTKPPAKLGMNLAGLSDWEPAYPLVDLFKSTRNWISQKKGAAWGQGPSLDLDEHGWVKKLETDCTAGVPLFSSVPGSMPAGDYTLLYEGKGSFDLKGLTVVSNAPGRIVVHVDKKTTTSWITITATDPADYVRNIRFILPGFEKTYQKNPWNPQFLERWSGVACLRFMDWMDTNHSDIETWDERPVETDMSYSGYYKGVPLELMIDLANRLNADAWFCMPGRANDEYVENFARMVEKKLNPKLKAYVEYSNEVWNGMFKQTSENTQRATELGIGDPAMPWEGNGKLYARRAVEIGKIWHNVFDDDNRVVRVLAWQCSDYWIEHILLPYEGTVTNIDAVAIAPYINLAGFPESSGHPEPSAEEMATWTEEQLLEYVSTNSLPDSIKYMKDIARVVHANHLDLIVYEGGQHMVGVGGGENNKPLEELLKKANKNPAMLAMYQTYFPAWEDAGGGLFCYFTSTSRWSKWGSWGVLDRYDADPAESPKYLVLIEWAQKLGQPMTLQDNSKK